MCCKAYFFDICRLAIVKSLCQTLAKRMREMDNEIERVGLAGKMVGSRRAACSSPALAPDELYDIIYKEKPTHEDLPSAGGDRKYMRLSSSRGPTVIGTEGNDIRENKAFVMLSDVFGRHALNVPEVYAVDYCFNSYLQTDLGGQSLLPLLSGDEKMRLSAESLRRLVDMQTVDEREWLPWVYAKPFSRRLVLWDLNYFKYEFVKPCAVGFDEDRLEDDFESFSKRVSHYDSDFWGFMYRDFQSRNIMVKDGEPYFIDYQGGRKGPVLYDAVSFLWQSKAGFTGDERRELLSEYIQAYSVKKGIDGKRLWSQVGEMALLRTLQVLGAYGFRGLVEKRAHFIESIPGALSNLSDLIDAGELDAYPELGHVCRQLVASRFARKESTDGLTVKVFSFSYKKGYPEDLSGNGGGFMFDCRGMHNPGRYEEYKPLTGLDREVIDFLESKGEVGEFLENALKIVSPSVECYRRRGFSSLQIGFGCTGGRHRSVYCAQHLAERIALAYPDVRVELCHRERGIMEIFNEK